MAQNRARDGLQRWLVLAGGFLTTMAAIGATTYSFGLYVKPVSAEFLLNRTDANRGMQALLLGMMLWSPLVGFLLPKWGGRLVIALGGVAVAAGGWMMSGAQSAAMIFAVILGPVALGVVAIGILSANSLVAAWFEEGRSRALGILSVSTSAGGFAIVPLVARLMNGGDWRQAALYSGFGVGALALLVAAVLIRPEPRRLDREAIGLRSGKPNIIGRPDFWWCTVAIALLISSDQALLASLIPHLQDQKLSTGQAAAVMSAVTFSAIAGKLVVGWAAERVPLVRLFAIVVACNVGLILVLLVTNVPWILIMAALTIGIAIGGVFPLWSISLSRLFQPVDFPKAFGLSATFITLAGMASIELTGRLYDRTGNYALAFAVLALWAVASTGAFWLARSDRGGSTALAGR